MPQRAGLTHCVVTAAAQQGLQGPAAHALHKHKSATRLEHSVHLQAGWAASGCIVLGVRHASRHDATAAARRTPSCLVAPDAGQPAVHALTWLSSCCGSAHCCSWLTTTIESKVLPAWVLSTLCRPERGGSRGRRAAVWAGLGLAGFGRQLNSLHVAQQQRTCRGAHSSSRRRPEKRQPGEAAGSLPAHPASELAPAPWPAHPPGPKALQTAQEGSQQTQTHASSVMAGAVRKLSS